MVFYPFKIRALLILPPRLFYTIALSTFHLSPVIPFQELCPVFYIVFFKNLRSQNSTTHFPTLCTASFLKSSFFKPGFHWRRKDKRKHKRKHKTLVSSENQHNASTSSERKHKRKHKEKEKFWCLRLRLCLRRARFHSEICALVLALVLASLVKTRLKRRTKESSN